jgi:hypothetical protein
MQPDEQGDMVIQPVVILRVGKRTKLSDQAEKDHKLINDRARKNGNLMPAVSKELELLCSQSLQKKDLIVVARTVSTLCDIPLDRLAKRSRGCLICWFCEHWPDVVTTLRQICRDGVGAQDAQKDKQHGPINSDPALDVFADWNGEGFSDGC